VDTKRTGIGVAVMVVIALGVAVWMRADQPEPFWTFCHDVPSCEARCEAGEDHACAYLALELAQSVREAERDRAEAVARDACDDDDHYMGCFFLAERLTDEDRDAVDEAGARAARARFDALATEACEAGDPYACWRLATYLRTPEGDDARRADTLDQAAAALALPACAEGIPRGCYVEASLAVAGRGGLEEDPARAAEMAEQACLNGELIACRWAAGLLRSVERYGRALEAARRGCLEADDLGACERWLGIRRYCADAICAEIHVSRDPDVVAHASELADVGCAAGLWGSCFFLADLERLDLPRVEPDERAARAAEGRGVAAAEADCRGGDGDICNSLGRWHRDGNHGVPADREASRAWFERGCRAGLERACAQQEAAREVRATVDEPFATCLVFVDGSLYCKGLHPGVANRGRISTYGFVDVDDVAGVAVGHGAAYAWTSDGAVHGWGDVPGGDTATPRELALFDVVEIAAGSSHACARHGDGTVSCWGDEDAAAAPAAPARVDGVDGATAIAAYRNTTCALTDRALWCWGGNWPPWRERWLENLGRPVSPEPAMAIEGGRDVALVPWDFMTLMPCVIDADAAVRCVGPNGGAEQALPLEEVAQITGTDDGLAALGRDGAVWHWTRGDEEGRRLSETPPIRRLYGEGNAGLSGVTRSGSPVFGMLLDENGNPPSDEAVVARWNPTSMLYDWPE